MTDRFALIPAVHLILERPGEILLARRFQTSFGAGRYSVVAGHLDGGETARDGMIREAREEAGIEIRAEDLHFAHLVHAAHGGERLHLFFRCDLWRGEPRNLEPDRCDDLRWFPLHALPDNMVDYVAHALREWRAGGVYSEFGWD